MPFPDPPALVSTNWLAEHLDDSRLHVVDASWYLPAAGRDARAEFLAGHVPGARFLDLDAASAPHPHLPHMLPAARQLGRDAAALGIGADARVVFYDGSGTNLSAPRAWFVLRAYGHPWVAVLDGGFRKWAAEGRPVERGPEGTMRAPAEPWTPVLDPRRVRDRSAMLATIASDAAQVVDMRSVGRFTGTEPEPRAGLRGGHIPGSLNLPFTELAAPDGTQLAPAALRARLAAAGVDLTRPVVGTCGSGTSACALLLALAHLGHDDWALYDGAWTEWGADLELPVERG
ncbi:MAG TPA: sulfurtransferase [Gemmatimonadaceae bacterium]|nr:sulfurtransferase [Gemmatimonadaceae bacterium]